MNVDPVWITAEIDDLIIGEITRVHTGTQEFLNRRDHLCCIVGCRVDPDIDIVGFACTAVGLNSFSTDDNILH